MNIIGIIVEYNPLHNGHIYQINKIKEMYKNSIIVVAMSTNFTERGEISVLNKWDKARLAIQNNVDIVLEIPTKYSIQSSDTFSYAALKMLNEFKIDTLVFGSESNDIELLRKCASIQINNSEFDSLVKNYLDKGENYPTSLNKAIKELLNVEINKPNDLLGVSYIKEIIKNNYNINPICIKRTNDYLDKNSNSDIISAINIRNRFENNENIDKYVPKDVSKYLKKINYNLLYNILKYKIICEKDNLKIYHLVTEGIESRIYKSALKSNNYNELIENIKTKRLTYNKVNRILMSILLGLRKEDNTPLDYIRLLALSKKGKMYYKEIKKNINLKVITKIENIPSLSFEIKSSYIYSIITEDNSLFDKDIKNHVIM